MVIVSKCLLGSNIKGQFGFFLKNALKLGFRLPNFTNELHRFFSDLDIDSVI